MRRFEQLPAVRQLVDTPPSGSHKEAERVTNLKTYPTILYGLWLGQKHLVNRQREGAHQTRSPSERGYELATEDLTWHSHY